MLKLQQYLISFEWNLLKRLFLGNRCAKKIINLGQFVVRICMYKFSQKWFQLTNYDSIFISFESNFKKAISGEQMLTILSTWTRMYIAFDTSCENYPKIIWFGKNACELVIFLSLRMFEACKLVFHVTFPNYAANIIITPEGEYKIWIDRFAH